MSKSSEYPYDPEKQTSILDTVLEHQNQILVGVSILLVIKNRKLKRENFDLARNLRQANKINLENAKILADAIALVTGASGQESLFDTYFGSKGIKA